MTSQPNPYQSPQNQLWPAGEPPSSLRTFDDAPIATFQFIYGENWFRQAFDRWWTLQRPYGLNRFGWVLMAILAFYFTGMFLFQGRVRFDVGSWRFWGIVATSFVGGGLGLAIFAKWRSRLNSLLILRRTKEFEQPVTFTLYREGCVWSSSLSTTIKRWAAFQSAVRYQDGVLLNLGLTQFYWLPFAAVTAGKIDDIDALMNANFADYQQRRV